MAPQSPALACAIGVTLLTCALTLSSALNDASQNPTIIQVTDNDNPTHNGKFSGNGLVGSATEKNFRVFMQKYGKSYSTKEEYVHRLGIFAKNIIRAAEHQLLDPTAVHGVTPFSDLSDEEFERMYTGMKGGSLVMNGRDEKMMEMIEVDRLPESFDWREKGAVTEVKMQVYI